MVSGQPESGRSARQKTNDRTTELTSQHNSSASNAGDFFPTVTPKAFGVSDIGRKRRVNQDQFLVAQLNKSMLVTSSSMPLEEYSRLYGGVQGQVLMVADGMGGHAAGEKASSLAVDHLINRLLNSIHWFFQTDHAKQDQESEEEFVNDLKRLLQDAHSKILSEAESNRDQSGMGTTVTMAHLIWPNLYVVHAGDSRCYLIRDKVAEQLTTDHTLARQMVESGGMKPEDEAKSRWSNVLWNVLGGQSGGELIAEVRRATLQEGDAVLLCSDGLTRYIGDETIAKVVSEGPDPETICARLVAMANDAGGEDNITAVVSLPTPSTNTNAETAAHESPTAAEYVTLDDGEIESILDDTLLE